ncbi:ribonuclease H-like domain-containing protein [Tanacetum coccineum]
MDLQDQGVIDSRCSRHMTGNMSYLTNYEEIDGGYVAFRGNPKGGKITRKATIKTGNLDFENVYFVRELKFNLSSVSQMYDKKNSVLFNDTECIVLSPNFKLIDESQVLLRVSRKNNMYSVDLKNIVPKGDHKVKVIRCDNGTEFKNKEMNHFCEMKGILRQFSIARTSQQNGVAERRNRTLIEVARTMLADSKFPTTFWAEAVNTACYVQN